MSLGIIDTPLHEAANVKPGDVSQVTKPDEMRKAMHKASYHSPWIRRAFDIADFAGFSGEDRYTWLAFALMLELERRTHYELRRLELEPLPVVFGQHKPVK